MRIFLGLTETAGYFTYLTKGFKKIGVKSFFLNLDYHPFNYDYEKPLFLKPYYRLIKKKHDVQTGSNYLSQIILKVISTILKQLIKIIFLTIAIFKYDIFIYGFGTTFFHFFELPILKLLKKTIIYVFQGSDSRPPYINGTYLSRFSIGRRAVNTRAYAHETLKIKKKVTKIEKYADAVICNVLSSHLHVKNIISYLQIGFPRSEISHKIEKKKNNSAIRILHSPSNPIAKGTFEIRKTINNLKKQGYAIDYIEIIGRPNHEVLYELQRCDFVIDQLYSDTPMAGLATEAAFAGKPSIVGGYGWDIVRETTPADSIAPSLTCHPEYIEHAIKKLIDDADYRYKLGFKAKKFVESRWDAVKVAERYIKIINKDIPREWIYEPKRLHYVQGACLKEDRAKFIIASLIKNYGMKALKLDDKPALQNLFQTFSQSNEIKQSGKVHA